MAAADRSVGQDSILEPLCFPEHPESGPCPAALDQPCPGLDRPSSELLVRQTHRRPATVFIILERQILEQPVEDFCSVIKTNSQGPAEKQEEYYLLCDVLPEDRVLREKLQQKRLEEVLEQQQKEREDETFHRTCMFCNEEFTGNRSSLLNHMAKEHSFSIGLPDNIVYCNQFLDTLQNKLDSLQCLYCEKTFRDKTTLKDHMRKKSHRRINSNNREYDRFYVINYLELGKSWEEVQSEDDRELVDDGDDDCLNYGPGLLTHEGQPRF
ncbi:hypothetical protein WMY93_023213 [Mugilogobius chulae]|uniref:C2H2-type domain-containing protein n=1 Tax=Mugilogobius chulae TaxID=88201 RepID=A0AAW0NDM0_9GOBI